MHINNHKKTYVSTAFFRLAFSHIKWEKSQSTNHREEDSKFWIHLHKVSIGEDELLLALLLAGKHNGNLLRGHRQDRQVDSIKLVKAAPRPRLGQACRINQRREKGDTNISVMQPLHHLGVRTTGRFTAGYRLAP